MSYRLRLKKKQVSKKQKEKQKDSIYLSMNKILDNISSAINSLNIYDTDMSAQIEKFVNLAFEKYMNKAQGLKERLLVSSRGEKTILSQSHHIGHKDNCSDNNSYLLIGFRSNPRKVTMKDNKKHTYEIRMGKCKNCGEKFSFMPSFLPREKHFGIEIIGSNMIVRLNHMEKREEFNHPILKQRIEELKANAPHYTMHNK